MADNASNQVRVFHATEFTPGSLKPADRDMVQPHGESFRCVAASDYQRLAADRAPLLGILRRLVVDTHSPMTLYDVVAEAEQAIREAEAD